MAKMIYIPDDERKALLESFSRLLKSQCYGKLNFNRSFPTDKRTARIYISQTAWIKMQGLVMSYDTEVQWHGLAKRLSECEFEIYDILVPPHVVTGTTVTSDEKTYPEWFNSLTDEQQNDLKMHGHSHVRMACSPSGTDMQYRTETVSQIPRPIEGEDAFYIFLILNKNWEWTGEIYDLKNDALYDSKEITLVVQLDDGSTLGEFIAGANKLATKAVVKKSSTAPSASSTEKYITGAGTTKKDTAKKKSTVMMDDDEYNTYSRLASEYGIKYDSDWGSEDSQYDYYGRRY